MKARQVQEDYIATVTRGGGKFEVEEVGGEEDGTGAGDAAPAEEDDGWTTVPARGKKGKGKGKASSAPVAVAAPLSDATSAPSVDPEAGEESSPKHHDEAESEASGK